MRGVNHSKKSVRDFLRLGLLLHSTLVLLYNKQYYMWPSKGKGWFLFLSISDGSIKRSIFSLCLSISFMCVKHLSIIKKDRSISFDWSHISSSHNRSKVNFPLFNRKWKQEQCLSFYLPCFENRTPDMFVILSRQPSFSSLNKLNILFSFLLLKKDLLYKRRAKFAHVICKGYSLAGLFFINQSKKALMPLWLFKH